MRIDIIDSYETFTELKPRWDTVYDKDPEAQFFLSWTWLSTWLEDDDDHWFILAARSDKDPSDYVAFFPLRLGTRMRRDGGFYNEISMAGLKYSAYTGFICIPEHLTSVIAAFARHLKRSHWSRFKLECLCASEERLHLLLQHFPSKKFKIKDLADISKRNTVDNLVCPAVRLPSDWHRYLASLSSNTQQETKRFLRMVDESDEYSIRVAGPDSIDEELSILLDFWKASWKPRKDVSLKTILQGNFSMLKNCFDSGALYLPVLRHNGRPLAALASFIDPVKRSLLFFIGGRDAECNGSTPPSFLLHAYSIRHAIDNGFKTYEFQRGNETYKYLFKPRENKIGHILISTTNRQNLGGKLDSRSLVKVLDRTVDLHEAGHLAAAEVGYKQVLAVSPGSAKALYGCGQLLAQKGKHAAAARAFRTIVSQEPDSEKAWLRLGSTLEARRRFSDAADAYRELIKHRPGSQVARARLAKSLRKLGLTDPAVTRFDAETAVHRSVNTRSGHTELR